MPIHHELHHELHHEVMWQGIIIEKIVFVQMHSIDR